jgi:glycosyltransferase involved in cell wall biosynthesis
MRILFVHSPADLYGASRSLLRTASRLASEGHCVCVLLPGEGQLVPCLRSAGVQVILDPGLAHVSRQVLRRWRHRLLFPFRVIHSCARTVRSARQFRPDLVHTNTSLLLPGGIVARLLGVPHLWHVREVFLGFAGFWWFYQWFLFAFSDRILCVSQAVARQFHPYIRERKVQILHNGYPASEFAPVAPDRVAAFRNRLGLNGARLVGLVGRIRFGRKGQDIFLEAASLLQQRFPAVKFLCIGSAFPGNEEHQVRFDRLRESLGLDGVVLCTGDVEDIKAAYAALEISVQPSVLPESFGGVVIESMAMGKPVIATDIGATPELIEDGQSGLLVSPGDARELAAAVERLLSDESLRRSLAERGHQRYLQLFEFEAFFKNLMAIYHSVVRPERPSHA